MKHEILLFVIVVAVTTTSSFASRKFTSTEYIRYDDSPPLITGESRLGVSLWIKRRDPAGGPGGTQIVLDNSDLLGRGFTITFDGTNLHFGFLALSPPSVLDPISITSNVSGVIDDWTHVAADVVFRPGQIASARLYINGVFAGSDTAAMIGPAIGAIELFVGGSAGETGFYGDIHDVCLIHRTFTTQQITDLQTQSAEDALTVGSDPRLFNVQLRYPLEDRVTGASPAAAVGTPRRGMGPAITYADQLPTVLVIGDTQGIASASTAGRMEQVGQFVVDYKATLDISAAFQVGDWVANVSNRFEADTRLSEARALADKFDEAGVPWACTLGNHDYTSSLPCSENLSFWSQPQFMPPTLFSAQSWFLEQIVVSDPLLERDDDEYAYAFDFTLGGAPQVGVALPYRLTQGALDWLATLDTQGKPIWIATHYFLSSSSSASHAAPPGECGDSIGASAAWMGSLLNLSNLASIMCGHVSGDNNGNNDDRNEYVVRHRCDAAADGHPVHQFLVNGMNVWDSDTSNPEHSGGGFLQIIAVDAAGQALHVESYVPIADFFIDEPFPASAYDPPTPSFYAADEYVFSVSLDTICVCQGGNVDCNGNGVPDCDDEDCNNNGIPDDCVEEPEQEDCNGNGIPDSCEEDCNFNGIPDECEELCGPNDPDITLQCADCDEDGVLDICCGADFDGNGQVDIDDIVCLILHYGETCDWAGCFVDCETDPLFCPDLDGDGVIDIDDQVILVLQWGPCP